MSSEIKKGMHIAASAIKAAFYAIHLFDVDQNNSEILQPTDNMLITDYVDRFGFIH